MFGFFKEVSIRQGGDYYGMRLILRVKGGKFWSKVTTLHFMHILFVGEGGGTALLVVQYGTFRLKGYFCN